MARRRGRYPQLSAGGRPKTVMDYTELVVARIIGRNLTTAEGCLVQIAALVGFLALLYVGWVSGLIPWVIQQVTQWYTDQVVRTFPGASPSP